MKPFLLILSFMTGIQAFRDTATLTVRTLAEKPRDTHPHQSIVRTNQIKRPQPDSGSGSGQGSSRDRNVRQRLARARTAGHSISTNQHTNPQSQGHLQTLDNGQVKSQSSTSSRSHSRGRDSSQLRSLGNAPDPGGTPAQNPASSQNRSSGRASVNVASVPAPAHRQTYRQDHRAMQSHDQSPSLSSNPMTLEDRRFPSPNSGVPAPDRNKPVQIHTAIAGPAHVIGRLGYPLIQHEEIQLTAGQSLNRLWADPYQAEIHITNPAGSQGINRSWAAGGRRASIRSDHVPRRLAFGSAIGLGGPVTHLNVVRKDQMDRGMGYIKASTRSHENYVAVDSMTQGNGLTVVRASNSRAGTASRPSSLSDTESDGDSVSNAPRQ